ncbi:hypothetical protein PsorP6_007270 [Peronosclerospora sorghi]|uniref:Uncharacterized protein n=1 Tax=Peronosclerospora sorghi TaxID=230839 RepID=A0ACC0W9M3_9STRA|nr:hypothetical protein PsorP6_007270 [Peronosclerospora sorghi]
MNDSKKLYIKNLLQIRVVLSIHDKQQVLQRLEGGEQPIAIALEFGISRQQVSDIKKNKERILAYCTDAKCISTLKRKTLKYRRSNSERNKFAS